MNTGAPLAEPATEAAAHEDRELRRLREQLQALPEGRGATPLVHDYLRACVLDGRLAPGEPISQVELAKRLGVSRTPLREALRMLQEEGFIEATTNRQARVVGFEPAQLDADYASRILLEALSFELTIPFLGETEIRKLETLLAAMRRAASEDDIDAWFGYHTQFHDQLTSGAGELIQRQVRGYADRSTRYIRVCQSAEPTTWSVPGDKEHTAIVAAIRAGDLAVARSTLATHLARTALRVIVDLAPDFEPVAVRRALALVGTGSGDATAAPAN